MPIVEELLDGKRLAVIHKIAGEADQYCQTTTQESIASRHSGPRRHARKLAPPDGGPKRRTCPHTDEHVKKTQRRERQQRLNHDSQRRVRPIQPVQHISRRAVRISGRSRCDRKASARTLRRDKTLKDTQYPPTSVDCQNLGECAIGTGVRFGVVRPALATPPAKLRRAERAMFRERRHDRRRALRLRFLGPVSSST